MNIGDKVQWTESFPDGFKSVRTGVIESYWGMEGKEHLYWVLPDNRNSAQSLYEGALTLIHTDEAV